MKCCLAGTWTDDLLIQLEAPTLGVAEKAAEIIRAQYNVNGGSSSSTSGTSSSSNPSSSGSGSDSDGALSSQAVAFWSLLSTCVAGLLLL